MENVKKGHVSFKFRHLIKSYTGNEDVADMYYDVFKWYEDKKITISFAGISEQSDVFYRIQEASSIRDGEIFKTIKEVYGKCLDYYISEENIGGETVLLGGEIIFTEEASGIEYSFDIVDIFEDEDFQN